MKKVFIFDLVGVIFSINKFLALKQLGIWRTMCFYIKYRTNPFDYMLRLLDTIRQQFPGEYQETVHLKGIFLPKSMCLWQEGRLSTDQVCKKMIVDIDQVISQRRLAKKDRRVIEDLCAIIFDSVIQAAILTPIKTTVAVLHDLKRDEGNRLYMLTNIDRQTLENLIQQYPEIFALFDGIMASYQVHLLKPDPAIYALILERYALNPAACCYIDDQVDNLVVAQSFGIKTVLFFPSRDLIAALK